MVIILHAQQNLPQFGSIGYHYLAIAPLIYILKLECDIEDLYLPNKYD